MGRCQPRGRRILPGYHGTLKFNGAASPPQSVIQLSSPHRSPIRPTATVYRIPTAAAAQALTVSVNSSAIARLGIIIDNDNMPHLLVIFKSNESKVYRYIFEDDLSSGAARRWNELLNDDDARNATSWGSMLHRALKHGDLETIEV